MYTTHTHARIMKLWIKIEMILKVFYSKYICMMCSLNIIFKFLFSFWDYIFNYCY